MKHVYYRLKHWYENTKFLAKVIKLFLGMFLIFILMLVGMYFGITWKIIFVLPIITLFYLARAHSTHSFFMRLAGSSTLLLVALIFLAKLVDAGNGAGGLVLIPLFLALTAIPFFSLIIALFIKK